MQLLPAVPASVTHTHTHTICSGSGVRVEAVLSGWAAYFWLHGREEYDLLDVVFVGEEHRQPVDAHPPATCRRQPVLESRAVILHERPNTPKHPSKHTPVG